MLLLYQTAHMNKRSFDHYKRIDTVDAFRRVSVAKDLSYSVIDGKAANVSC